MATIRNYGPTALLRSEACSHVIRYRNGQKVASGRGLVFWFMPERASIVEVPMDDRETTLFVRGRSQDFQDVAVQGTILWHISDPERLAERIDFTIELQHGRYQHEPLEKIEARLTGLAEQATLQFLAEAPVRSLLDAGIAPLQAKVEQALIGAAALADIGIDVVTARLGKLAPSKELERALQTPTFEALQQKADEAVFERRALAVDKERAIAENELANRVELARREMQLITEQSDNDRQRAKAKAEAGQIEADAEAARIRTVEGAKAATERERIAIYSELPTQVLLGLAAREFAGNLTGIDHLNVTPDLLATVLGAFKAAPTLARPD